MSNLNLNFDAGSITVNIQGDPDRPLTFNPRDYNISAKFFGLIKNVEEKQQDFLGKAKTADESEDPQEALTLLVEMDSYFRAELDAVFGDGASQIIFQSVNVASTASNGDTVLANFLMALYPYFEDAGKSKVKAIIQDHKPKLTKPKKK